jgi:hypothetical protein
MATQPHGEDGSAPHGEEHARVWARSDQQLAARLPKREFERLADVRRAMWTASLKGMLAGGATGALGFYALAATSLRPPWLRQKHLLLATLLGAAAGGFMGSSVTGRRRFGELEDTWERERHERRAAEREAVETESRAVAVTNHGSSGRRSH